MQYAAQVGEQLGGMSNEQMAVALDMDVTRYTDEMCASIMTRSLSFRILPMKTT